MSPTRQRKIQLVVAFISGLIFAVGLALSGMTQPGKVIGFFDFSRGLESWDPSLAFVMAGGMAVFLPTFRFARTRTRPFAAERFRLPTSNDIDRRLIVGASLFGIGWGMAGYCPGPAITSLGTGSINAALLVGSMLAGMKLFQVLDRATSRALRAAPDQPTHQTAPDPEPER